MKHNIYFLIRSLLISLLFFLLLPLLSFAQSLPPIPDVGEGVCVSNCGDTGINYGYAPCLNADCLEHGVCNDNGRCTCDAGWTGLTASDCSIPISSPTTTSCRNNCSGHGSCNSDGSCSCYDGWAGSDCSIPCPTNCSVHGFCDGDGGCICDYGWSSSSSNCSVPESSTPTPTPTTTSCSLNGCSGHGTCDSKSGFCNCNDKWSSNDCSVPSNLCPNFCGVGYCSSSLRGCICDQGWSGLGCSSPTMSTMTSCPNDCSEHGFCSSYGCICDQGYSSIDCSVPCPNKCSGHGICIDGSCSCDTGWSGSNDCSVRSPDEETVQIIEDIMRNVAALDLQTLQKIEAGDYPSALPIINHAIESLISARDTVRDEDEFTTGLKSELERLLESAINNLKKAYSYIESIVYDPKARLSRLLKDAKKKIMKSLFTGKKAEDVVDDLVLGDKNSSEDEE